MTRAALVRLVAFVLVIAGSFGTAYGMGRRLPGNPESKPHTEAQGAKLHVVVVHADLSGFQHLTPDVGADGTFIVPIDKPGKWHIIIDAQPVGAPAPIVLSTNVDDEVPVSEVKLPAPADTVTADGPTIVRQGLNW